MGWVLSEQGDFDQALLYFNKALNIWETALGSTHPFVAESLSHIGMNLVHQGKPKQAREALERVLAICKKATCDQEPVGRGLFWLAQALVATDGHTERAIELAQRAREVFGKSGNQFQNRGRRRGYLDQKTCRLRANAVGSQAVCH